MSVSRVKEATYSRSARVADDVDIVCVVESITSPKKNEKQ